MYLLEEIKYRLTQYSIRIRSLSLCLLVFCLHNY